MSKILALIGTILTISPLILSIKYIIQAKNHMEAFEDIMVLMATFCIIGLVLMFVIPWLTMLFNAWLIYFNKKFKSDE